MTADSCMKIKPVFYFFITCVQVEGLPEALEDPTSGIASNFSEKYVTKTFELIKNFKGGNAIFTMPTLPIKCPGAPQKIMYLAEDYFCKVRSLRFHKHPHVYTHTHTHIHIIK